MSAALAWTPPRSAMSLNFDQLLDGLVAGTGLSDLDAATAAAFLEAPGRGIVMLSDEPDRSPEAWDLAVIFPELLRATGIPARGGLLRPGAVEAVQKRYGVRRLPALLFVRDAGYLGVIEGLRDWSEFVAECAALLQAAPSRPPGIGIPVRNGDAGCGEVAR